MKRILSHSKMFMAVAAITMTACGGAWAAGVEAQSAADQFEVSGKVASVDPKQNILTVEQMNEAGKMQQAQFKVDARALISDGKQQLLLDQLKPGQEIVVRYIEKDGIRSAHTITLGTPQTTGS